MTSCTTSVKVGFLGAGNMVAAIVRGMVNSGWDPQAIMVTDRSGRSGPALATETGVVYIADAHELVSSATVVVAGMKPHQQATALEALADSWHEGQVVVSIAAGRSTEQISQSLPTGMHVVRIMPNVAAAVGASMTALCLGQHASEEDANVVKLMCASFGQVQIVDEALLPAFTALAGCSPAWFAATVDALAQAGVAHGISKHDALLAAATAMAGTGRLIQSHVESGGSAADIVDRVCSPAGTTVAGLLAAEDSGLRPVFHQAVSAAVARDTHLGKN